MLQYYTFQVIHFTNPGFIISSIIAVSIASDMGQTKCLRKPFEVTCSFVRFFLFMCFLLKGDLIIDERLMVQVKVAQIKAIQIHSVFIVIFYNC